MKINTIELLEKFKNSLQNNSVIGQGKEGSTHQILLEAYKFDAFEILIENGFEINASEYKKLEKEYIKMQKKKLSTMRIELTMRKYEHTLLYLIEIGCSEYLKSFKPEFINKLKNSFTEMLPRTDTTVYDVPTGAVVGTMTSSGKILLYRGGSHETAICRDELVRRQKNNDNGKSPCIKCVY